MIKRTLELVRGRLAYVEAERDRLKAVNAELVAALINLNVLAEIAPEPRGKAIEFRVACNAARAVIAKATA